MDGCATERALNCHERRAWWRGCEPSLGWVNDVDRPRIALYVALGLVVCVLGVRYLRGQPASAPADTGAAGPGSGQATQPGAGGGEDGGATARVDRADGGRITVHVAGAVRHPGLYRLPAGSRIAVAVRRAGGARRHADLTAINLATKLEDGRQVLVPERPAAGAGAGTAPRAGPPATGAPGTSAGAPGTAPAAPVNLNTATLEQLDTLDGVGPGIAQRIIGYRDQHGGFRTVDELGEVPGIGDKRLAALRPAVTV